MGPVCYYIFIIFEHLKEETTSSVFCNGLHTPSLDPSLKLFFCSFEDALITKHVVSPLSKKTI